MGQTQVGKTQVGGCGATPCIWSNVSETDNLRLNDPNEDNGCIARGSILWASQTASILFFELSFKKLGQLPTKYFPLHRLQEGKDFDDD